MKHIMRFAMALMFSIPFGVSANLSITEVMYDPEGTDTDAGGEWIEIEHTGSSAVDLTDYKIADRTGESGSFTNRTITYFSGSGTIPAGSRAIVAKDPEAFSAIFSSYQGPLYKAAFSLTDEDELEILDSNLSEVDALSYTQSLGGKADGNTIQKDGDDWTNGTPTPGEVFAGGTKDPDEEGDDEEGEEDETEDETETETLSSHNGPAPISTGNSTKPLSLYIGEDRLTAIGSPLVFSVEAKNPTNSKRKPKFVWSMGDGRTEEGDEIEYLYDRAGTYTVVVNAYEKDRRGTARIEVSVRDPKLAVRSTALGDIEVENQSESEINLYDWRVEVAGESFTFPLDTILVGNATLALSPDLTRFAVDAHSPATLRDSEGRVVAESAARISMAALSSPAMPASSTPILLFEIMPASFSKAMPVKKMAEPAKRSVMTNRVSPKPDPSLEPLVAGTSSGALPEEPAEGKVVYEVAKPESFWRSVGNFFRNLF